MVSCSLQCLEAESSSSGTSVCLPLRLSVEGMSPPEEGECSLSLLRVMSVSLRTMCAETCRLASDQIARRGLAESAHYTSHEHPYFLVGAGGSGRHFPTRSAEREAFPRVFAMVGFSQTHHETGTFDPCTDGRSPRLWAKDLVPLEAQVPGGAGRALWGCSP